MSNDFFKFPHTPHLYWLGDHSARSDKIFNLKEAEDFLSKEVIIEEKIDGANIGISLDSNFEIRIQNRGSYLTERNHSQFKSIWNWINIHEHELIDFLEDRYILFGEWCYAIHSVKYKNLPDYFLAFDIYDKLESQFWNVERRNNLLNKINLEKVPELFKGQCERNKILDLLESQSAFGNSFLEGIYLRKENDKYLEGRCKVVRKDFTQNIEEHWSKKELKTNSLRDFEASTYIPTNP